MDRWVDLCSSLCGMGSKVGIGVIHRTIQGDLSFSMILSPS